VVPALEMLTISLSQSLEADQVYTLYLEFTSIVNSDTTALYYSEYQFDNTTHYLASTDFQAPDARQAFPCFDEPQFKAEWELSIIRLPKYQSLSNMQLVTSEDL
jgi:aminopeptidase N